MKIKKIRHARPFFLQGNRDFSSGRPHKKLLTITSIEIFKKSAKRDHFSLKEIAIFHHIAPIKNLLTITSIENFQKSGKRDHFSLREIAIFHQVAPIKNILTIILCARSAENFSNISLNFHDFSYENSLNFFV